MPEWLLSGEHSWLLSYGGLFLLAFLAATLLPLGSEWLLLLLLQQQGDPLLLWLLASSGNILGSVLNYTLGYWASGRVTERQGGAHWQRAQRWYQRYGIWSVLFAWLPFIGDPLTLIAGIMRAHFMLFLLLVTLGKSARYALLILAVI